LRDDRFDTSASNALCEVKEMAVRAILTRCASRAQLARDLGIGQATLSRWVRDAFDQSPYGDVLACLHDDVGNLLRENAALQKALRARK
jgi:transposase-like protein